MDAARTEPGSPVQPALYLAIIATEGSIILMPFGSVLTIDTKLLRRSIFTASLFYHVSYYLSHLSQSNPRHPRNVGGWKKKRRRFSTHVLPIFRPVA